MKKNLLIAASAIIAMSAALSSCQTTPSTKVEIKTEMDSISYSFGASVGENLEGALQQMKIVSDTMMVVAEYTRKIESEQDATKKAALTKEMRAKVDSTHKANVYNTEEFLQGFAKAVNSRESETSYNFGFAVGSQVAMQGGMMTKQFFGENTDKEINKKAVVAAATASLLKKTPVLQNASSILMMKSQEMQQKQMMEAQEKMAKNKAEGEKFLEDNKGKEGVVTLASGVQYKVLAEGKGDKPKATDMVKCHYHGTLIDGTVFDSSVNRGEPVDFEVDRVIPGWTEILQLMPVGSKWEVYIPSDKAYGEYGSGEKIGPNSALIFQVELLDIVKK